METIEQNQEAYFTKGILEAGAEGVVANNDQLYNEIKSGQWRQKFLSPDQNVTYTIGANDGKNYMAMEQHNIEAIREECRHHREFYRQHGTDNPFFAGTFHAMKLPKALMMEISGLWFDSRPWDLIKLDKEDKIKFYAIVNEYYSDFVCHPSGKIPLPYTPAIPTPRRIK